MGLILAGDKQKEIKNEYKTWKVKRHGGRDVNEQHLGMVRLTRKDPAEMQGVVKEKRLD
jgi:hypothetical protein